MPDATVKVLGVDPGATGAFVMLSETGLVVLDMPTFLITRGRSEKAEVDVRHLAEWLASLRPDVCYFEQVGGMKGQAAGAAFNFGRSTGLAEAAVKLSGARFVAVPPATWKRRMGLLGAGKDAARQMAANQFPDAAAFFRRAKDDGRAEAALLAEYGRRIEAPKEDIFA
jgi:crossover junction endodeoxyribonuclease RuvC